MYEYFLESCVETHEEAVNAEKNGAHQLELCSRLDIDGLTPAITLIEKVLESVKIPVKVMVRPHDNGFEYSKKDISLIYKQVQEIRKFNIDGLVFGALKNKRLDIELISQFAEWASPFQVTIHKVIDSSVYPIEDFLITRNIPNVNFILSSGQANTAVEGISMLRKMKIACGDKMKLIVAGKVTAGNLGFLHKNIGAEYYHGRKIV